MSTGVLRGALCSAWAYVVRVHPRQARQADVLRAHPRQARQLDVVRVHPRPARQADTFESFTLPFDLQFDAYVG
jgi:hypothetical protein